MQGCIYFYTFLSLNMWLINILDETHFVDIFKKYLHIFDCNSRFDYFLFNLLIVINEYINNFNDASSKKKWKKSIYDEVGNYYILSTIPSRDNSCLLS